MPLKWARQDEITRAGECRRLPQVQRRRRDRGTASSLVLVAIELPQADLDGFAADDAEVEAADRVAGA
jgi:hypothetical protein